MSIDYVDIIIGISVYECILIVKKFIDFSSEVFDFNCFGYLFLLVV